MLSIYLFFISIPSLFSNFPFNLLMLLCYQKTYGDEGYRSPCPSHAKRMLYHMSYIPLLFLYTFLLFLRWLPYVCPLFSRGKNASGGVRTHASLDSRSWDGPLRPLGHECFLYILHSLPFLRASFTYFTYDFIYIYIFLLPYSFYYFLTFKNASGGVRTHASLDSRA